MKYSMGAALDFFFPLLPSRCAIRFSIVKSIFFWAIATRANVTLHSPFEILDRVGATAMFKIYDHQEDLSVSTCCPRFE